MPRFVDKDHIGPDIPGLVWVSNHSKTVSEAEAIHSCHLKLTQIPIDCFRAFKWDYPSGQAIAIYCEAQYAAIVEQWHDYIDAILSGMNRYGEDLLD